MINPIKQKIEMEEDRELIYWRHPTLPGIKVEEISGGRGMSARLQELMACQIYCENGRDDYREIGHFQSGAPFLYNYSGRISISHTEGLYAVATLPPTPEVELKDYTPRAALGIDVERADREQVKKLRDRIFNADELEMIPADDTLINVIGWTIKEAAYKAALVEGLDFRRAIRIERMPLIGPATTQFVPADFGLSPDKPVSWKSLSGRVVVEVESDGGEVREFDIYTYLSEGCVVTLVYSPKCAKFGKES